MSPLKSSISHTLDGNFYWNALHSNTSRIFSFCVPAISHEGIPKMGSRKDQTATGAQAIHGSFPSFRHESTRVG